jgi:hypothetical protein
MEANGRPYASAAFFQEKQPFVMIRGLQEWSERFGKKGGSSALAGN